MVASQATSDPTPIVSCQIQSTHTNQLPKSLNFHNGALLVQQDLGWYSVWRKDTKPIVGFTRIAVNFKFHSWILNLKVRVHVNDSFRNLKLISSFETTMKSYGKRDKLRTAGGPTRSLRMCECTNFEVLPAPSYEWPLQSLCAFRSILPCAARVCIFHAHTIVRAEGRASSIHLLKYMYFRF